MDASSGSRVKILRFEHKTNQLYGGLYSRSYFYGSSKKYGSQIHGVSIFMRIQKLWQIFGVSIACAKILDDIFVSTARMQKNRMIWFT
jgi:hypothetical protein